MLSVDHSRLVSWVDTERLNDQVLDLLRLPIEELVVLVEGLVSYPRLSLPETLLDQLLPLYLYLSQLDLSGLGVSELEDLNPFVQGLSLYVLCHDERSELGIDLVDLLPCQVKLVGDRFDLLEAEFARSYQIFRLGNWVLSSFDLFRLRPGDSLALGNTRSPFHEGLVGVQSVIEFFGLLSQGFWCCPLRDNLCEEVGCRRHDGGLR